MNRRNFVRDTLLILAASLLPKIIQPTLPKVEEEEMVDIKVDFVEYVVGIDPYYIERKENSIASVVYKVTKSEGELIAHYVSYNNEQLTTPIS